MARFRYLPVMISRLMISLKKAAAGPEQTSWTLTEPSPSGVGGNSKSIKFFHSREGTNAREDVIPGIPLDTYHDVEDK